MNQNNVFARFFLLSIISIGFCTPLASTVHAGDKPVDGVRQEQIKKPNGNGGKLIDGVREEQIKKPSGNGDKPREGKQTRPGSRAEASPTGKGIRWELGILPIRLSEGDKLLGVLVMREKRTAVGDPDYCTVTVYRRFCRVISNNPYIEQCYWMPSHVEGKWNDNKQCCQVTVDGRKICARDAIYQPF